MTDLSPETRALLGRGGDIEPLSPSHRARLKRSVLAKAAAGATIATTTAASASASAAKVGLSSLAAKVTTGLAVVAMVGGAGAVWYRSDGGATSVAPAFVTSASTTTMPSPSPSALSSLTLAAPQSVSEASHGAADAPSTMEAPSTMRAPAPAVASAIATASASGVVDAPASAASNANASAPRSTRTPAPRGTSPATSTSVSTAASQPSSATPSTASAADAPGAASPLSPRTPRARDPLHLEEESRLLREADAAIKNGAPDRALALLAEHATRFPASALEPEREAERVFALCEGGRVEEARTARERFLSVPRPNLLASRVRASCPSRVSPR